MQQATKMYVVSSLVHTEIKRTKCEFPTLSIYVLYLELSVS